MIKRFGHPVATVVKRSAFLTLLFIAFSVVAEPKRTVEVATRPGEKWTPHSVRLLEDLPPDLAQAEPDPLDQFGGNASRKIAAKKFFYTTRLADRWWLVDPEGALFLHKGVASVKWVSTASAGAALNQKFGSAKNWAAQTTALLRQNGFNGLGAWSDTDSLRAVPTPLVYTRIWNFMSAYGRKRGGTFQQPGHTGYPGDCIFVFDPDFETFCQEFAKQLRAQKDDPWLLGHFSDNEMPLKRTVLRNYLNLPENDWGHRAARAWLQLRHGEIATIEDVTPQDEVDFLEVVVGRYFRIVSAAIRKNDPNHLFLGSRFYGGDLDCPQIFRAAGPHVDVLSVNWYRSWTPNQERLAMWERESGKPVLITEWYAKGEDSGMPNKGGAGWLVKTQRDRGWFYENFALALSESPSCVGWHWFKYIDNDPDDTSVDPSNRDSNKGIVNNRYEPYPPLLESMKRVNTRLYRIAEYFAQPTNHPGQVGSVLRAAPSQAR